MLPPLLSVRHALVHAKVPVHVRRLLAAAVLGGLEAAAALGAGRAEVFVEAREEVRAEATVSDSQSVNLSLSLLLITPVGRKLTSSTKKPATSDSPPQQHHQATETRPAQQSAAAASASPHP